MKEPTFYCDSCGLPVPAGAGFCPHCGGTFKGVRCPSCGYQGEEKSFRKGCPACGFLAEPSKGGPVPKDSSLRPAPRPGAGLSGPDKPKKPARKPLSGLVYTFILLALVGLLGLFLVIFVFQVGD